MLGELNLTDPLREDSDHYRPTMFEWGVFWNGTLQTKTVAFVTLDVGYHLKTPAWSGRHIVETSVGRT